MSRYSLILVTIDCLRADHVSFLGYNRPTTPFLDSLAQESFIFPAAIVGGLPTYYSLPAILASRHPLALGRDVIGLAPGEPSLASVLQSCGYATAAFSAANPYISKRFGYNQGFARFDDFLESPSAQAIHTNQPLRSRLNRAIERTASRVPSLRKIYNELYFQYCQRTMSAPESMETLRRFPAADVIVDHALAWIESVPAPPYFAWLHLMDPHSPYYPKQEALNAMDKRVTAERARYVNSYWNRGDVDKRLLVRHRNEILELYDAGIRWAEMQIARLVDRLRRSGEWDNCVLVVTADHGEEFLDHGGRYHPPSRMSDELMRVPLLIRVPGFGKTSLPKSPFSLVHLAPTLLDVLGVPAPPEFRGTTYWPTIREGKLRQEHVIVEAVGEATAPFSRANRVGSRVLAVRGERYKLILEFASGREILFDLDTDPHEQNPLPPHTVPAVRRRLLERTRHHLESYARTRQLERRVEAIVRELRLQRNPAAIESSSAALASKTRMNPCPIKVLWLASGDADNTNAQSLNAREIALRLDPELFASTFFFEDKADPRLTQSASMELMRFPVKRRTWTVLRRMLSDYRIITYIDYSPASYIYLHLPRAIRRHTTTVMHVEGPMKFEGLPKRFRLLCQGIIPRCDAYTAISEFVSGDMQAHGLHAVTTLPAGVDTRRFVPPAVRKTKAPTVLFAGAVMERKGVLSVLEVARELPEARFLMLGAARDGFDAVVRKRIEELSVSNVQLLGPVSQDQMIRTMQESDIFLLPSRQEGLPKVTLEAAATGLPCVIFNSYQTPSVVHGVTGFQAGSLGEMVGQVKLLVENPAKRQEMSAAAVRHAKSFDWDVIAPKWQEAYLQMVHKPARLQPSAASR